MSLENNMDILGQNLHLIFKGARDVSWYWDLKSRQFYLSGKWSSMTGYEEVQMKGTLLHILSFIDSADKRLVLNEIYRILSIKPDSFTLTFRLKTRKGASKWVTCSGAITFGADSTIFCIAGSLGDHSKTKALEQEIEYLNKFDTMTGLPNARYIFNDFLVRESSSSSNETRGAAFFIDLDDFGQLNEMFGSEVGNEILKKLVDKVRVCVREQDQLSKMEGDLFLLLLEEIKDQEAAEIVAERLLDSLKKPFSIMGEEIYITFSIGIVLSICDIDSYSSLIQEGNEAIREVKKRGKNQYVLFQPWMSTQFNCNFQLEKDLRKALLKKDFELHYQPIINIQKNVCAGMEALVRWNHKQKGMIAPSDFIPIAEEKGLIVPLGSWVLAAACVQNKDWQNKGYPKITVAVNVSALQLQQGDFCETVKGALEKSGLEPEHLELEVTESALIQSMETTFQTLLQLKKLGVRISLDDFGTSYSSMKYLKYLPVDKIKMDRSFVRDIHKNKKNEAIISSVIELSHKMKIDLVAEGVETEVQLDFLRRQGCKLVQGYLFSRPLPPDKLFGALHTTDEHRKSRTEEKGILGGRREK